MGARMAAVHLRTLRIRGFKSFPDSLEISLEPGVAVIVGPNGSGKSNIADAIVWAAGSLTPSELRAEKPDDVLFAGGGDRKQAEHCEVELVFDNEDGAWPDLDFSEVSIARRLVRGAEGQYLVNRAAVRRTDLVEILSDVGLGAAMHSIVGQGKVEQVLASKPEDRRAFVEEAAGLGKFKRRRHRAELKLARVALQVERARDVEEEVRKRLRPLALQATAAERAEKLAIEIAGLRARIAQLDLADSGSRRAEAEERRDAAAFSKRGAQGRLEGLLADRARAEEELSDAAGRREAAVAARYRLQGGIERLELRSESAAALLERFRAETPAADEPEAQTDLARLELEAARAAEAARRAERERTAVAERAVARARARPRTRAGARRAGGPAARSPRSRGGRCTARARRTRGRSRCRASCGCRASNACGWRARRRSCRRARAAPARPRRRASEASPCSQGARPSSSSTSSRSSRSRRCSTPRRLQSPLRASATTRLAVSSGSSARRPRPSCSSFRVGERRSQPRRLRSKRRSRPRRGPRRRRPSVRSVAEAAFGKAPRLRAASIDVHTLGRLVDLATALRDGIDAARRTAGRFEAPLRARVDAGSTRAGELGEELRTLGAAEVKPPAASSRRRVPR